MKGPLVALALSYAIFFGCLAATLGELPARMASHFDAAGVANGWMGRSLYLEFMTASALSLPVLLLMAAWFVGVGDGRLMNLPHREYWLAAERQRATIQAVQRFMIGFCSLFVLFFTGLHLLVVAANAGSVPPHLSSSGIGAVTGTFLVATLIWGLLLVRRFLRVG